LTGGERHVDDSASLSSVCSAAVEGRAGAGMSEGGVVAAGYVDIVVAAPSAALVAAYVRALTIITCNESDKKLIETLAEV